MGKRKYSSYSFMTSLLNGGEWSASRTGHAIAQGKDPRYLLDRKLGEPHCRSGQRLEKNPLTLPEIDPQSPGRTVRRKTIY
jgi:hypothetical protein